MKKSLSLAAMLVIASAWAHAQVVPQATGRGFGSGVAGLGIQPITEDLFDYSLRYSQTAYMYTNGTLSDQATGIASGSVRYVHASEHLPTDLNFIGGYIWPVAGPSLGTGTFQRLYFSQGFIQGRWGVFGVENLDNTPEAPSVGFSGVAGTGEPISGSGTGSSSSPTILNINTRVVSNIANGEAEYRAGRATTFSFGGGSQVLNFPNGGGLNTLGELANAGISRSLSSRTSILGQYLFAHFGYGASPYSDNIAGSYNVSSLPIGFQRELTREFTVTVEAGPQWVTSSANTLVPPTTTAMVNASATDRFRMGALTLAYNRGVEASSGYFSAAVLDSVSGDYSRKLGRKTTVGVTGDFVHFNALQNTLGTADSTSCGGQVSQNLGRYLNFSANYAAIHQLANISSSVPQANALSSLYHIVSFSLALSPREMRVNQ